MTKFALEKIEAVKGKIDFYKLKINGKCDFDEFCEEVKKDKKDIIGSIFATFNSVSNLMRIPPTRYKELIGRKRNDQVKDYEAKKDAYRVYFFKHSDGRVVVFGSVKGNQTKDINRLRKIKQEYIKSLEK